jgi:hypothetical protein
MRRSSLVLLTVLAGASPWRGAHAQGNSGDGEAARARWRLSEMRKTFCVQWLLNPDSLRRPLPRGARLLPAATSSDLHPALRGVVANQPEYRNWTPSALCFYRMGGLVADARTIDGGSDTTRLPVLGVWTVAAETGAAGPRTVALELRANSGDMREAGRRAGLELERLDVAVGPVLREDGQPRPDQTRYQIRFGKTILVWDGRMSDDTARTTSPVAWDWQAVREKGGWLTGALTLTPAVSSLMIGSLRVEGKDPLARALQASPIRYVGPAYQGGEGELTIK